MLTDTEMLIFIFVIAIATFSTRIIPFIVFHDEKKIPKYIDYLGRVLPYCITGFLIVYCLKDVSIFTKNHGIPELIAIIFVIAIHIYKKNMLLSVTSGTILYMILVNIIFI